MVIRFGNVRYIRLVELSLTAFTWCRRLMRVVDRQQAALS